jgi:1-phosphatidylinositol-4-phosphate 5-kinase
LRKLEEINIDDMIKSFLPNNNKEGMKKSAGKSGSFFISTDDQEYMIKTLKKDELELIRHSFLNEYIMHIKKNPKSLICRIYGMYSLIQYGGTEIFVIVMRNVIGSLKNNIVAKFDLKGSTINREIKGLDMSKIDNGVMKDVNFNDIEFGILVNNDNNKKINKIAYDDSKFLAKMGLMDYSLFIVKLSLNKEGMKKSAGKSGSFFISTDDQEYMIKTLKKDELELIRHSFLNEYITHIKKNPKSLICRIYGMFSLIQYGGTEIFVIVMRNVIGSLKNNIVAKFDLKGSTINREIKGLDMSKIDNGVMKDVNFNDIEFGILVNNDNNKKINKIAYDDSKFLAKMGLMDYSLFIVKLSLNKEESSEIFGEGIQEKIEQDYMDVLNDKTVMINPSNDTSKLDYTINTVSTKNSFRFRDSKFRYYKQYLYPGLNMGTAYIISIIDFLQSYNFYKIMENTYKTTIKGKKSGIEGGISCVEPKLYSERFINYVRHLTEVKHILTGK